VNYLKIMTTNPKTPITRRALLAGAAGAAAAATAGSLFGQQMQTHMPPGVTPKPRGPLVYLDYDKEEIDAAYDQAQWAPNQGEAGKRNRQKNDEALARLGKPRRLSYGPTEIAKMDLYATKKANAPIQLWIHGGAWRAGSAAGAAYQAEMFVDLGAHFIAVDFNNVIETKGNLMTMADQVRRAVAWVYRNAASFGGDRNRIYISGHSSGAHLTGVALTTDWQKSYGLPADIIKGGLCASGMYDLYPVSLSSRSSYVNFTSETIQELSSQGHLDRLNAPVIVADGPLETPEFQRQNREFAEAVKSAGKPVTFIVMQGYNHFEVAESLGNPYGPLGRAILIQMRLRTDS